LIDESCSACAQARSWRETPSASDFRFEIRKIFHALHQAQHGTNLAGGTASDGKKREKFLRGPTLEAFRYVVGH